MEMETVSLAETDFSFPSPCNGSTPTHRFSDRYLSKSTGNKASLELEAGRGEPRIEIQRMRPDFLD